MIKSFKNRLKRARDDIIRPKSIFERLKNRLIHYRGQKPLQVLITGQPRAGTSFLAGFISRMGFSLGPREWLKPVDENNPYGYYECLPLLYISRDILAELGGSIHEIPEFYDGWEADFKQETNEINRIVEQGGIELYKGNRLMLLAPLYDKIFPEASWIYIRRREEDVYESEKDFLDSPPSHEEWKSIYEERYKVWKNTAVSAKALEVSYEGFKQDIDSMITKIESHLDISLSSSRKKKCKSFFNPRN